MSDAFVHPTAVVDPTVRIGQGCVIGPFAVIEAGAILGDGCRIGPHVCVTGGVTLGSDVQVAHGAVLGGNPQISGFLRKNLGCCVLGDGARVGEFATVHCGSHPDSVTEVGEGTFLMAYAHVGHDCKVGTGAILANAVQLGGHVEIGDGAFLGGASVIHQFCRIGELAFVAGGIPVDRDVLPWSRVIGNPAAWARLNLVGLRRAGWSSEEIRRAGVLLRPVVRKERRMDEVIFELQGMDGQLALRLTAFLSGGMRGVIRARH